jgi:hypothetical protein
MEARWMEPSPLKRHVNSWTRFSDSALAVNLQFTGDNEKDP